MKQEIKYQVTDNRAFMFLYGNMTTQGIIDALHELYALPGFRPRMDVVYDARCASFISFTIHDLIHLGIAAKRCSANRGEGGRSAIVIKSGDAWTVEMFNTLNNSDLPSVTRIFDKIDEAFQWLDSPLEPGTPKGNTGS